MSKSRVLVVKWPLSRAVCLSLCSPSLSSCCLSVHRTAVLLHQLPASAAITATVRKLLPTSTPGPIQSLPAVPLPAAGQRRRASVVLSLPARRSAVPTARTVVPGSDHIDSRWLLQRPATAACLPVRPEPSLIHPSRPSGLPLRPSHFAGLPIRT